MSEDIPPNPVEEKRIPEQAAEKHCDSPAEEKPLLQDAAETASHAINEQWPSLKPIREFLERRIPPTQAGWYIFAIIVISACSLWWICDLKSDLGAAKTSIANLQGKVTESRDKFIEARTKAARIEGLDSTIQDLNFKLVRAENERDNARAKLSPFEIRAAQLYTNELPSEQLNKLFKEIQPDEFNVSLNGVLLTNLVTSVSQIQPVNLSSHSVQIKVKNLGRYPLQGLTIYCFGRWLTETNVEAKGWDFSGSMDISDNFGPATVGTLRVKADSSYPAPIQFTAPPIRLKTNQTMAIPIESGIVLPTFVYVHSSRSDMNEFKVLLILTNDIQNLNKGER